jgi:hypothetical protein
LQNYSNPANKQYIIVMTDGEPNESASDYSCLPPLNMPGTFAGRVSKEPLCHYYNALTEAAKAKNDNINLYAISYKLSNTTAEYELMKQVASYPEWHFNSPSQINISGALSSIFSSTCGG